MDIQLISGKGQDQAELEAHARRRLQACLMDRSDRIVRVSVRLSQAPARGQARDTCCVMSLQVRGAPASTVVHLDADAHQTIDRAAERVGRLAAEQLRQADRRDQTSSNPRKAAA